jgi:hypothetical protein
MPLSEDDQKQIVDMATRIYDESDRGAVLVAQAYLEEAIREFVIEHLAELKGVHRKSLKAFFDADKGIIRGGRELIELAMAVGIIIPYQKSALSALNTLRNKFAHKLERKHLTNPDVHDVAVHLGPSYTILLNQITTLEGKPQNLRSQFSLAAAMVLFHIRLRITDLRSQ